MTASEWGAIVATAVAVECGLALVVGLDARRHGYKGVRWGVATLVLGGLALWPWLIVRARNRRSLG